MQYRFFGNAGVRVSRLGYGAMRLPMLDEDTVDYDKSTPLLQRAIDLGVNYLDSAWIYQKGSSEVAVGKAIKDFDREELVLATKIPVDSADDASPDVWRGKLEESLRRFDTPYIDMLFMHSLRWQWYEDWVSKPGMALDVARQAKEQGLIRHICFSSHDTAENIIKLVDTGDFEAVLMQYNFLDRHNEPAIAHAAESGLGVAIMGPVAGGRLATPQGIVVDEEGQLKVSTPELALRFVWSNPYVSVALSGMSDMDQVEENCAAADKAGMSEAEQYQISQLVERNEKLAELYCTGCGYCMPCPNDVNIPENFRYMNWLRVWGLETQAKEAYAKLSEKGTWGPWIGKITGLNAEACIQCGECEPKCPQNIPIMEQLEEVAAALGEHNPD
jgi:predicted aldo/keto reductase-like oxidoreductase